MEHVMRCNAVKCRAELKDQAVVTTCSHIFCLDCSKGPELSGENRQQGRSCPACGMQLTNLDDAVVTNLNPTEDYKTSVLSGLSPNIIMECAGRSLSFWAYQTSQEIVYQHFLTDNLTDKYSVLSTQMDKVIHDANAEISNLRTRLSNMQAQQDSFRRKNEELVQAIREKSRKQLQTQELYDKLKRRSMLGQVQNAAADAVDHIRASASANRYIDMVGNQGYQHTQSNSFPDMHTGNAQNQHSTCSNAANVGSLMSGVQQGRGSRTGLSGYESADHNRPQRTPSTHRQHLAPGNAISPRIGLVNLQSNIVAGTPMPQQRPSPRQPPTNLSGNGFSSNGLPRYGMSAGMKISNPVNTASDGSVKPLLIRSRVCQRPSSAFLINRNAAFGQTPPPNMFSNAPSYY